MGLADRLRAIDEYQQRHRRLSFVVAVYKKFADDEGGSLAALIAYYGFISIFPLLLVFVTVLGFVIHGNPAEQARVLNGALGQIPLLKVPLTANSLTGSPLVFAIGLIGSLIAGMAITNATQRAFSRIWQIPRTERPNFLKTRGRGIALLFVLGALNLLSSAAVGFATSAARGTIADLAGILIAFLVNVALFLAAYVFLTAADVGWRELMPGVIVGAIGWQIVQHLGGLWASRVGHQQALYGEFGLVLGLLAILYLGARILVLAAEINVVRARRLWPRSMLAPPPPSQRI
jgi:YihY family inner membrane protein